MALAGLLALASTVMMSACSAALDWREVRPEGDALKAWLPCKPERQVRALSLGGRPLSFELLSCTAGDTTWGIASAAVDGEDATRDTLRALRAAQLLNLDGREVSAQPLAVKGAATGPEAVRFKVVGRRPDGSELIEHAVVFAHGGRVFHVAAVGGMPSAQALEMLFDQLEAKR